MSLVLSCRLIIGKYEFSSVADVRIDKSRKRLGNTATITLPARYKNEFLCNVLKGGDSVIIGLGYNGKIEREFEGYVVDVAYKKPVEIRCEDEMYLLKRIQPKAKSWRSVKLIDIMKYLVSGVQLREVPDITLSSFAIKPGGSVYAVLQQLRDTYGLDIFYTGKTLTVTVASYADGDGDGKVKYHLERNVINPALTYRRVDDVRLRVKAISILPNNKRLTVDVGDDEPASTTTMHFYNVSVEAELRKLATDKLSNMKYTGFSGSLTTFGVPYVEPGMVAMIKDTRFNDSRSGSYLIESVATSFGKSGFRREVTIGRRVSSEQ